MNTIRLFCKRDRDVFVFPSHDIVLSSRSSVSPWWCLRPASAPTATRATTAAATAATWAIGHTYCWPYYVNIQCHSSVALFTTAMVNRNNTMSYKSIRAMIHISIIYDVVRGVTAISAISYYHNTTLHDFGTEPFHPRL